MIRREFEPPYNPHQITWQMRKAMHTLKGSIERVIDTNKGDLSQRLGWGYYHFLSDTRAIGIIDMGKRRVCVFGRQIIPDSDYSPMLDPISLNLRRCLTFYLPDKTLQEISLEDIYEIQKAISQGKPIGKKEYNKRFDI